MKPIVFLYAFLPLYAFAQAPDSLLRSILLIQNDTEQVNRLYKQGFAIRNSDPAQSYRYARLCEQAALASGQPKHIARSYNLLGVLFYRKGDFSRALRYHKNALALRKKCDDRQGQAYSLTNAGNVYNDLGLYALSEKNYLDAMAIYQEINMPKMVAASLLNLGTLRQLQKQTDAAKEYYLLALKHGEERNDYELRTMCLNNLADVCFAEGNYERAVGYNMDALKLADMMENRWEKADAYLSLGANQLKMKNLTAARASIDTAIKLGRAEEYFEVLYEATALNAEYFAEAGDFKSAYTWQFKYTQLRDSLQNERDAERNRMNFDEAENFGVNLHKTWNNIWLLTLVLAMAVAVPVFLMRYKR